MKNWSLSQKIWSVLGLLVTAFIISVAMAAKNLVESSDALREIGSIDLKRALLSNSIRDGQRQLALASMETILAANLDDAKKTIEKFDSLYEPQQKIISQFHELATGFGREKIEKYLSAQKQWLDIVHESERLKLNNQQDEAFKVLATGLPYRTIMLEMTAALVDFNEKKADETIATATKDAQEAIWITAIISLCSISLSLIIAFFVLRAVTKAIGIVVQNLSDSSIQVSGAAAQIASSSEELSQSATEQAASLEETAASVEEMNSMVAKNSENANSAAATSNKSQDAVSKGQEVIKKMMESMEHINRSSEGMAEVVKVIEQIDKKTKVINEIVNKTELLSFNASVEAARAGEHGKGFAVVAEEVGNLARMSGTAAEEIAALLEESIHKVNEMTKGTKESVVTGTQVTRECGDVFQGIVENVTNVTGMATEIASASQEQSRGITEITKAMTQLDQMTQQNASTSEECASAAEELSAQADALKSAVGQLVTTINGGDKNGLEFAPSTAAAQQKTSKSTVKATSNVAHLKTAKAKQSSAQPIVYKKASGGDTPSYDSSGFNDI